jgi:leader peptidase (prepilin peptidase)/N-methyltransferase
MAIVPSIPLLAISCALGWALLVLATVDALAFRLPDILTLPLIVTGLAVAWWLPEHDLAGHAVAALIALLLFYAIATAYLRVRHQDGLGLGDVKLAGAAGAWLGWQALPYVVLLACALGLVWAGVAMIQRGREASRERIPFGIALCIAIWVVWLYGPPEPFGPLF